MSKSVLFIDAKVRDYQTLLVGLGTDVEVYLLNAEEDGGFKGSNRVGLDSIQIFSHGSSGALALGSGVLNTDNVSFYADALAQIGSALSATGDILLYGCDVAQGDSGLSFRLISCFEDIFLVVTTKTKVVLTKLIHVF